MRSSAQIVKQLKRLERTCLSTAERCVLAESRAAFRELALTYGAEAKRIGGKTSMPAYRPSSKIYARVRAALATSPRRLRFTSF